MGLPFKLELKAKEMILEIWPDLNLVAVNYGMHRRPSETDNMAFVGWNWRPSSPIDPFEDYLILMVWGKHLSKALSLWSFAQK